MKLKANPTRRVLLSIFAIVSAVSLSAQNADLKEYEPVFAEALKANKNVILVFGHAYCGWCRVYDRYHADPEVKEILEPEYIIHKIDILESEAGKKLFEHYQLYGTPVWMIFDPGKNLLADGKDENGRIVGYPYSQTEISIYLDKIGETSDRIGDAELDVLRNKLQEYGNSRSSE